MGFLQDAGNAYAGYLGGGLVGGAIGGFAGENIKDEVRRFGGRLEDMYQSNFQAKPYDYNEEAFQDPYREENKAQLEALTNYYQSRGQGGGGLSSRFGGGLGAPQDPQAQARARQMDLVNALTAQSRGEGPSLAQMQLKEGADRNLAQAMGMMGTAGGNPAMALRGIGNQRAQVGQQLAGQAGQLRLQEQQGAQDRLASALQGVRQGDFSNRGLDLQQQQLNDAMVREFVMAGMSLDQAQFAANQELERLKGEQSIGVAQANAAGNRQMAGSVLNAGGGLLSMFI